MAKNPVNKLSVTVRTKTGALNDWSEIYGGDGQQPLVHPTTPTRIWAEYQYGALNYSANDGASWVSATGSVRSTHARWVSGTDCLARDHNSPRSIITSKCGSCKSDTSSPQCG